MQVAYSLIHNGALLLCMTLNTDVTNLVSHWFWSVERPSCVNSFSYLVCRVSRYKSVGSLVYFLSLVSGAFAAKVPRFRTIVKMQSNERYTNHVSFRKVTFFSCAWVPLSVVTLFWTPQTRDCQTLTCRQCWRQTSPNGKLWE